MINLKIAPEEIKDYGHEMIAELGDRRPLLWDSKSRTLYVGNPGWHHTGIFVTFGLSEHEEGFTYGWIGNNNRDNQHGEVGWYGFAAPEQADQQEINEVLERELGIKTEAIEPGTWRFGAEASARLDWDEGYDGKGVLDGMTLYTWNDGVDYDTHEEYVRDNDLRSVSVYLRIEPDGEFQGAGGNLLPQYIDVIEGQDPRLKYVDQSWSFGGDVID